MRIHGRIRAVGLEGVRVVEVRSVAIYCGANETSAVETETGSWVCLYCGETLPPHVGAGADDPV